LRRFQRNIILSSFLALTLLAAGGRAEARFLDDDAELGAAVKALRAAIGTHPRVLKIEMDPNGIEIEAQDPNNRNHVDLWRYGAVSVLGVISFKRLSGPQPVNLQLINPDLEANLFDLDAVDLAATPKLLQAAVARAKLQDAAAVTRIEIVRRTFILPQPTSGDVRWTVRVDSGREHAEVYANAQGAITGADLGGTQRAKTLNLLDEPGLVADAAEAFRGRAGAGAVLTNVSVDGRTVGFHTNMRDQSMARLGMSMPATATFTWDLNGLQQRLGAIDIDAQMGRPGPAPFGVDDVDWTILAKLKQDALAKVAAASARVKSLHVEKSSEQPGGPALAWTVEIVEPSGETTKVIADQRGAIQRVVLQESRRPKPSWLDPGTIAGAIARVAPTFGPDAKIASIAFDDRGGKVTLDDASQGGRPATFEFSADTLTRASISFSLDAMGPRFGVGALASINEQKIAALQAEAFKRLAAGRTVYMDSIRIGAHALVQRAGAQAIEVRLRDVAQDSAQAQYAWIVFDLDGRVLDLSKF
jgi:hypothetical protein